MHSDSLDPLDALAAHPLYQLSTAGQELFHTNMLYWLIKEHPTAAAPVLKLFGLSTAPERTTSVSREWQHFDLFVDNGVGQVVLENKLHAFPDIAQLERYRADLPLPYQSGTAKFVLLSIIEPLFTMPEPWTHIGYQQLIGPIEDTSAALRPASVFGAALLDEYVGLLRLLLRFRADIESRTSSDQPVLLDKATRTRYQEGRVLSLVEKYRISALSRMIQLEVGQKEIGLGLTNTHAIAGYFVTTSDGHAVGWQYQAGKLRLAIQLDVDSPEQWRGKVNEREAAADAIGAKIFDNDELRALTVALTPYGGKRNWLVFQPNFLYKYSSVTENTTYSELAEICIALIRYLDGTVPGTQSET
ncbi:PD-(D/E)XK nuclease family protein [Rhodococcus sp. BP22]|uniref:PD-(D/E)XK nuclease family protein n=1 Tax=Rhodococcus sp. BP22 TaxID=2758566 RepID=UPI0016496A8A|nr:PD-(D/E)XK nuclease family protein [Rhodococcus sp. BP22]